MLKNIIISCLFIWAIESSACSMYKITKGDKTLIGCNEDAWRSTPHVWFENANNTSPFGAAFTGSRVIGTNLFAPQSGMNTQGLAFSRLASYHPEDPDYTRGKKQKITHPDLFLKGVLHRCSTVTDVKKYLENYDYSIYLEDVLIYVDRSGKYLIVEPYSLTIGNDSTYVLSNFCPSITPIVKARKLDRYRDGVDLINKGYDTTLQFCKMLSDSMHVCRNKHGDGTLLTSIWDSENSSFNLYFYHDYKTLVSFNIQEELAKGNRTLPIDSLFPPNKNFQQLANYITPFNTPKLRTAIAIIGAYFLCSSFVFLFSFFRRKDSLNFLKLGTFIISILIFVFMIILATNQYIYYFDAPMKHYGGGLINITSYIPWLLLICIIPILIYSFKISRIKNGNALLRTLLNFNSIIYLFLIFGFYYWGLF